MKADKMHKRRKNHAKTERKSRKLGADKMNNIRIYRETSIKPAGTSTLWKNHASKAAQMGKIG